MNNEKNMLHVAVICEYIIRISKTVQYCIDTIQKHEQTVRNMIQLIQIMRQLQNVSDVAVDRNTELVANKPILYVN